MERPIIIDKSWMRDVFILILCCNSGIRSHPAMYMKPPAVKGIIKQGFIFIDRAKIAPIIAERLEIKLKIMAFFIEYPA